jgi:acyl carrier protein
MAWLMLNQTRERVVGREVTIEDMLYAALAETRGCTPDDARVHVGRGGEIDSLEGVELITAVEVQLGIALPDDALTSRNCRSIPHIVVLINNHVSRTDSH